MNVKFSKFKLSAYVCCILVSHFVVSVVHAEDSTDEASPVMMGGMKDIEKKNEGWFFYNEKIEQKKQKPKKPAEIAKPKPKPKPTIPEQTEKPMPVPEPVKKGSVKWYRENIQKIRDEAIDNPTRENVTRYYYTQRILLDKASQYADTARLVTSTDPIIDENNRRSTSTFAAMEQSRIAEENKEVILKKIANRAGVFFFYKGLNCSLCEKQNSVLTALNHEIGINIIPISIDGITLAGIDNHSQHDSGQAKKLGIYNVPALALAIPPHKVKMLSYSAISLTSLRDRIILIAKDSNIISDAEYKKTLPFNDNGYIDSKILESMPDEILKDPEQFVEYIRSHVERENKRKNNGF